mmetsp:Transcript_9995/g.19212  ORF Transcript_9995/g.19212 Transcript_9995/m.19212 type:complete len:93 (-) Transcript_9995:1343-1621(-)
MNSMASLVMLIINKQKHHDEFSAAQRHHCCPGNTSISMGSDGIRETSRSRPKAWSLPPDKNKDTRPKRHTLLSIHQTHIPRSCPRGQSLCVE